MTYRRIACIAVSALLLGALLLGGTSYYRFRQERRAAVADCSFVRTFESREPLHDIPGEGPGDRDMVYEDGRAIVHEMSGHVYMVVNDYETGVIKEYINNVLHSVLDTVERERIAGLKARLIFSRSITIDGTPTEVRSEEECIAISELLRAGQMDEIIARYRGTVFQSEKGTYFVE